MLILTNCLSQTADEGALKAASSLVGRIKQRRPDTAVITYERRTEASDVHLRLNKLLLSPSLISVLREKKEPVLYIPFPARMLPTALRVWILSRSAKWGLRVVLTMCAGPSPLAKWLLRRSGAELVVLSKQAHAVWGGTYLKTGVDTRRFAPVDAKTKACLRRKYGAAEGKKTVLHVGHLKEGRNIRCLLDVDKKYHVFLAVSTLTERDEQLRKELESREKITILDTFIPNIEELYQMADVYLFPVTEAGNCIDVPLSVLEAAACNVPVVASDYGELCQMLGKPGFLPFDPARLNESLEAASAFSGDVRSAVLEYDWENAAAELVRWEGYEGSSPDGVGKSRRHRKPDEKL